MDLHEWIRSIGAIGTTASALVAVVTYVKATQRARLAKETEAAQQLRERLQRILAETEKLYREAHSGTALIAATAAVAQEIEQRLPPTSSPDDIKNVLLNDPLLLSASVTGWHRSRAGVQITDRMSQLELEAAQLPGGMRVLTELVDLLSLAIYDGYSPVLLHGVLTVMNKSPELWTTLVDSATTKRLIDELTVAVQSNASAYYVAKYDKAMLAMRDFVQTFVAAVSAIPDGPLVALARSTSTRRVEAATRTASIRQLLKSLTGFLGKEDLESLDVLVANVETYLRKEHALSEAANLGKKT